MARVLKDLLTNEHPLFLMNVARLERATGDAGVDVRLIGEITDKANRVIRALGLDPSDTRGTELYQALRAAVRSGAAEDILRDTQFVLASTSQGPISFNIRDVVENVHHELPYENRIVAHAQRALRQEIIRRYADHERTDNDFVRAVAAEIALLQEKDTDYATHTKQEITTMNEKRPYILAVGDIFADAFIKLNEQEARIDTDPDGSKRLSLPFGSKPPYDEVEVVYSVGPSPNAAVSFSRLGARSGLMAFLGDDAPGSDSLAYLKQEQVDTSTMSVQQGIKSNYYYVLRYGADRTILVRNEKYDYTWKDPQEVPDWIYLSLLGGESWQLHEDLLAYLEHHPEIKLAFQPGTFHFKWGAEKLAGIYRRSHIVVMNREEAVEVTGKSYDSLKDLTMALHELGPQIVVVTDGPNGSYASYDYKLVQIPNYPDPAPPLDRTGAGDAFASTIVAALAQGESMDTALTWAPINSMSVVQKLGAQAGLLHKDELKKYLAEAPEWYKVTGVNE
jgi:ribokinase